MDSFKVGDKIIYPAQGIGIVEEITEETFDGQSCQILHIRLVESNTLVVIPSQSAAEIGLRKPISQKQVTSFFQFFKDCRVDISADWKDRYKENFDLMKSAQRYRHRLQNTLFSEPGQTSVLSGEKDAGKGSRAHCQ